MNRQWLITWNPQKWKWKDFDESQAATMRGENVVHDWTCQSKGPKLGDNVFLEVLGAGSKRGIIASGKVVAEPYLEKTWKNTMGRKIKVSFDVILPLDKVLPQEILKTYFPETNWSSQSSGIEIKPPLRKISLEAFWQKHVDSFIRRRANGIGQTNKTQSHFERAKACYDKKEYSECLNYLRLSIDDGCVDAKRFYSRLLDLDATFREIVEHYFNLIVMPQKQIMLGNEQTHLLQPDDLKTNESQKQKAETHDVLGPSSSRINAHAFSHRTDITSFAIPNGVTEIGESAFSYCTELTSITIPNTVKTIRKSAFIGCGKLTSVVIPNGITEIDESVFSYCTGLTSVIIPDTVKIIRKCAFIGCYNLSSISIPEGVTEIGESAFSYCKKLTSIILPDTIKTIRINAFSGCVNLVSLPEAMKWYRNAAKGDSSSQFTLGECYYYGRGVSQNRDEAARWYRKAAEQGDTASEYSLGYCYYSGEGVVKDYIEAVKLFQKAADKGYAPAQNKLGNCYLYGYGVTQDYVEAAKWYRKAADKGLAYAQSNLGECYLMGKGVNKNQTEAMNLFRKAAEQGDIDAQHKLEMIQTEQSNESNSSETPLQDFRAQMLEMIQTKQSNESNSNKTGATRLYSRNEVNSSPCKKTQVNLQQPKTNYSYSDNNKPKTNSKKRRSCLFLLLYIIFIAPMGFFLIVLPVVWLVDKISSILSMLICLFGILIVIAGGVCFAQNFEKELKKQDAPHVVPFGLDDDDD